MVHWNKDYSRGLPRSKYSVAIYESTNVGPNEPCNISLKPSSLGVSILYWFGFL